MMILGLGSNVGDRAKHLERAVALLARNVSELRLSSVYESAALLPEGAPAAWNRPFLNMALAGKSTLRPRALLAEIKRIEAELGRKSSAPRWSPREIDIDILAYGNRLIVSESLEIPHPRLPERPFALVPLAEIAPDWVWPQTGHCFKQTARQLAVQAVIRFPHLAATKTSHRIAVPCPA